MINTFNASQKRIAAWVAIAVVAILLVWLLAPVLMPFVVAAVLAYALQPAVNALQTRKVPRVVAVLVVETLAILAILAVLLLLVPILSKQIPMLREQIPLLAGKVIGAVAPWLNRLGVDVSLNVADIREFVIKHLGANAEDIAGTVLNSARLGGSVVLSIVGNAILIPVVLFFLLLDWPTLVRRAMELVPPRWRETAQSFLDECDQLLGQYMRGQLWVMLILAVYYTVGLAAFGFSLALPVGVFTGLLVFVPFLGFGVGLLLALLAGALQFPGSWYGVGVVAGVYTIGQIVESYVLTPRLVGERIGLSPIAVIFALLAFGHLLGFIGVLIALPMSAVVAVAVRRGRAAYMRSELFQA